MGKAQQDIAERLAMTRRALGYDSQAEFCRQLKIAKDRYHPFETGKKRISLNVALKMYDRFNIPLDWIYRANPAQLPKDVFEKLDRTAA